MKYFKLLILILTIVFLNSCAAIKKVTTKRTSTTSQRTHPKKPIKNQSIEPVEIAEIEGADAIVANLRRRNPNYSKAVLDYIEKYNDIAILEMIEYKVPASITLAQGLLESQNGRSRLAVRGNNHFGIKCHKSWTGKRIYHDDDRRQECFRKYKHSFSSFKDHSLFLYNRDRYASLFNLNIKNYKGWARGLRKAGYATDPKYPKKLIALIEKYELHKYDAFNKSYKYKGQVNKRNNASAAHRNTYIIVSKGDTLYSIAKNNGISIKKLKWINGLKNNELKIGQKIYVK